MSAKGSFYHREDKRWILFNLSVTNIYGVDLPSQLALLPEISDLSKLQDTKDSFSFFHLNIRSLSVHCDELLPLLISFSLSLDVIGISESKEQMIMVFSQMSILLVFFHAFNPN